MKSKILLLSILIILPAAVYSQTAWQWQYPKASSVNITSSCFFGHNTGWFAGEGTIIKTTNGGNSFINSVPPFEPFDYTVLFSVSFGSFDFGIATSYNNFFKTIDGGNNWFSPVLGSFNLGVSRCFMVSESTGWIAGDGVVKSTNGFITWTAQHPEDNVVFKNLFFLNIQTGWIISDSNIYKTINGGDNWTKIYNPLFDQIKDIQFINENTGWIVTNDVLKSTNGGINWFNQLSVLFEAFHDICFISDMTGWTLGYNGEVYLTTDGGNNWNYLNTLYTGSESVIYFDSAMKGFTAGYFGNIYKSDNGGLNWSEINQGTRSDLYSSYFINSHTGWIAGSEETILKTTDGGINWFSQNSGINNHLYSVFFNSENDGWAAGNVVLKTTNGGINWIIQSTPADVVKSVFFTSPSTGWMAGECKLIKTTDSGLNWNMVLNNCSYDFSNAYFISESTGWIANLNGSILRTTDGGNNWHETVLSPSNDVRAVYFPDNQTGFAVCAFEPQIYKSTDSGISWYQIYGRSNISLNSVFFINVNTGFVAGDRGEILKTTNSGLNWFDQPSGTDKELYSLSFSNNTSGWITGSAGIVLHTSTGGEVPLTGCGIVGSDHLALNLDGKYYSTIGNGSWELENSGITQASISLIDGDTCYVSAGSNYGLFYLKYILNGTVACFKTIYIDLTLPVNLSSFTSAVNGRNIILNWSTSSEKNNAGFEIQRRRENSDWFKTGFVKGKWNSQNVSFYTFEDKKLNIGSYSYRLKQVDYNGNTEYYDLPEAVSIGVPDKFILHQNYPNPFNPQTIIQFEIPYGSTVKLYVYDVLGREVTKLVNEYKDAGYYDVKFNGSNFASGVYFYRLEVNYSDKYKDGDFTDVKKMVILR